jgi:hypothetical protein
MWEVKLPYAPTGKIILNQLMALFGLSTVAMLPDFKIVKESFGSFFRKK